MNEEDISIVDQHNADFHFRQVFTVTIRGMRVFTIVTRKASAVRKWIYKIRFDHRNRRNRLVVGLGVQWHPPMTNRVATLQVCVGRQCLIFQIANANFIPRALIRFLSVESTTFVGVRNHNDSRLLIRDYNLRVNRLVELGSWTNFRGNSMEMLASRILRLHGIRKDQNIAMSNWDCRWLSEAQIQYACLDAFISFEIGKRVNAWKYDR